MNHDWNLEYHYRNRLRKKKNREKAGQIEETIMDAVIDYKYTYITLGDDYLLSLYLLKLLIIKFNFWIPFDISAYFQL
jgi:hypothetical protein